jgi:hypothetical protein
VTAAPRLNEPAVAPWAWPIALLGALLSAVCIVFSAFHFNTNGDSVVPVLVSTVQWSPHYWGADRFGMVLPLLALAIENPFANLLAQNLLSAFLGLLAPFCLARYLFGPRLFLPVGAACSGLYVAAFSSNALYTYLSLGQCYAPALGFGHAALCLLSFQGTRRATLASALFGLLCLGFAFWMTPSLGLTLLPLIVLKRALGLDDPFAHPPAPATDRAPLWRRVLADRATWLLLAVLAAFGLSSLATLLSPYHGPYALMPLAEWPGSALAVVSSLFVKHFGPGWAPVGLLGAALTGLGLLLWPWDRRLAAWALKALLTLGCAVLCETMVLTLNEHVRLNDFDGRYLLISRNLLCALAFGLLFAGIYRRLTVKNGRSLGYALSLALLAAALLGYGAPSTSKARASLDQATARYAPELMAQGCTHLVGDYWLVWPAVFAVNLRNHEQGSDARLWGVTERAQNTQQFWAQGDYRSMRVCGVNGDPSAEAYLRGMGALKTRMLSTGSVSVYLPSLPLAYGAALGAPQTLSFFPDLLHNETVARPYVKGETRMLTLEFKGREIYGYILEDARSGERQFFLDPKNSGEFIPSQPGEPVDFGAYGIAQ